MFDSIVSLFNINTIMFTVMNYSMSYLEFFGTIANLFCVYLAAKNKILTWPVGLVGVILYLFLFYQIQLYSDFFEQIYFFFASFYGWYLWRNPNRAIAVPLDGSTVHVPTYKPIRKIQWLDNMSRFLWIALTIVFTFVIYNFMQNIHLVLPTLFPKPVTFPFLDAFTTIMSFVATILMAQRKIDCWIYWIVVDIIGIWLYWTKGVKFISIEYIIFLGNAIYGLYLWIKQNGENQLVKSVTTKK
jgi:nicotinamide mononucleotide transporter